MVRTPAFSQEDLEAFHENLRQDCLNGCKIACMLVMTVFSSFFVLDYVFVPKYRLPLFGLIRFIACFSALIVWLLIKKFGERLQIRPEFIGAYICLSVGVAVVIMVHFTGGHRSPYYAGIGLIMFGYSLAVPGKARHCLMTVGILYLLYLFSNLLFDDITDRRLFVNNNVFLAGNMLFAIITTQIGYVFRRNKFFASLAVEKSNASLKRVNEQMLKVASQAAHDIRSPLTSLQAVLRQWKNGTGADDDYLNLLELSVRRLHAIANEILERPERKKAAVGVYSLHRVLDELIGEFSSGGSKIVFQKSYGEALSCFGRRDKIQRAFGNIVKNAAEAMNGRGRIIIQTKVADGFGVVEILDTGPGMDREKLRLVLSGGFTEGKKGGHGIGMQVVREAVEEQKGFLEAESEQGHGTTFRIKLPLAGSKELLASDYVEEGAGQFELAATQGEQVVIIDDDPSAQLQWELIFRENKLDPFVYESYEHFEKKSAERPSLKTAIVDYHYDNSELNGFQIIERLRQIGYQNLYLCTGEYWKPQIQQKAKSLGIIICPKPIPKVAIKSPG